MDEKTMGRIQELVESLGVSGAEAFRILVASYARGQWINAFTFGAFTLMLVFAARKLLRDAGRHAVEGNADAEVGASIAAVCCGLVSIATVACALLSISHALSAQYEVAARLLR